MRILSIVLCFIPVLLMCGKWMQTYRYEIHGNGSNRAYTCKNVPTAAFTQLICLWNALQPDYGYFSFWERVHDKRTQKWFVWNHLHDWGEQMQRSHYHVGKSTVNYYVRLESERQAVGFEIRVISHNGADITDVHRVYFNISCQDRMVPECVCRTIVLIHS